MQFDSKWRNFPNEAPKSLRCETKAGAEQWAFKRLDTGAFETLIEDKYGKIIVNADELKRRMPTDYDRKCVPRLDGGPAHPMAAVSLSATLRRASTSGLGSVPS